MDTQRLAMEAIRELASGPFPTQDHADVARDLIDDIVLHMDFEPLHPDWILGDVGPANQRKVITDAARRACERYARAVQREES
jgi:hypothetical protein